MPAMAYWNSDELDHCLSDVNSCDNRFGYTATTVIESDAKDLHIHVLDVSPDEEDDASGQEMNSSNGKGKVSIDDALSSALRNFYLHRQKLLTFQMKTMMIMRLRAVMKSAKNASVHLIDSEKINHIQVLCVGSQQKLLSRNMLQLSLVYGVDSCDVSSNANGLSSVDCNSE